MSISKTTGRGNRFQDIAGKTFNRLTVITIDEAKTNSSRRRASFWICQCACGNEKVVASAKLISGHTQSCGCLQRERASELNAVHGLSLTPEHKSWSGMKNRCLNSKDINFRNYGGRGIRVCGRYQNSFDEFFKDLGLRPSKNHSIGRVDNDGHYSCGKCTNCNSMGWTFNLRWETSTQQNRNKRSNCLITFNGQTKMLIDWADELKISRKTLWSRLTTGWTVEEALSTPVAFKSTYGRWNKRNND
jgi:hypothetical protein